MQLSIKFYLIKKDVTWIEFNCLFSTENMFNFCKKNHLRFLWFSFLNKQTYKLRLNKNKFKLKISDLFVFLVILYCTAFAGFIL